jgi:hypothetical protein
MDQLCRSFLSSPLPLDQSTLKILFLFFAKREKNLDQERRGQKGRFSINGLGLRVAND